MKQILKILFLSFVVLSYTALNLNAQIPQLINYQGNLHQDGNPLTGTVTLIFSIYNVETGGTALWSETQTNVEVNNGLFNVMLGSTEPFPENLFRSSEERYLGINIDNSLLEKRFKFSSVAYSLSANYAEDVADHVVVKSINSLKDSVTITGPNVSVDSGSNTIIISADSSSNLWSSSGNNIYYLNGRVGIGTNQPTNKLSLIGEMGISEKLKIGSTDIIGGLPHQLIAARKDTNELISILVNNQNTGSSAASQFSIVQAFKNNPTAGTIIRRYSDTHLGISDAGNLLARATLFTHAAREGDFIFNPSEIFGGTSGRYLFEIGTNEMMRIVSEGGKGKMGIGTRDPQATTHLYTDFSGPQTLLILEQDDNTPGNTTDIEFRRKIDGNFSGEISGKISSVREGGTKNGMVFQVRDDTLRSAIKIGSSAAVGINTIGNPTSELEVNGFTKLGSNAPGIKFLKLQTDAPPAGEKSFLEHGLSSSQILWITAHAKNQTTHFMPGAVDDETKFDIAFDNENIIIHLHESASQLAGNLLTVFICYEEF